MEVKQNESAGFTLIEVLASLVILSLFIGSLVMLTADALNQSKLNSQKQAAIMVGHDIIAKLAVDGFSSEQSPLQITTNGVEYTVTIGTQSSPMSQNLMLCKVDIEWNTNVNNSPARMKVSVTQVLPQ